MSDQTSGVAPARATLNPTRAAFGPDRATFNPARAAFAPYGSFFGPDAPLPSEQVPTDTILYVNGAFVPKSRAVISVYDSSVQHGDGVYEGIRVYGRRILMLREHLRRLYASCRSLGIAFDIPEAELTDILRELVRRNLAAGVHDIHIRLEVSRGLKRQTGMHPSLNVTPYSLIICVDEKPPIFDKRGVRLVTSTFRRYAPDYLDPKIHSCNQLNQILAAAEALRQGADEAVMLDQNGFIAETNSANLQLIRDDELVMPTCDALLPGITRSIVKSIVRELGLVVVERNVSLSELYNADEAFICGTVGEIAPVAEVDGHRIGGGFGAVGADAPTLPGEPALPGPWTRRLSEAYRAFVLTHGVPVD